MEDFFSVSGDVEVGSYGRMIHEMTEMVRYDMGQFAHGNQPIQYMPYLYSYAAIKQGGTLRFRMSEKLNDARGITGETLPYSVSR